MATKSKIATKKATLTPALKGAMGIQILQAKDVAIPLGPPETPPEFSQLRQDFFAGKEIGAENLRRLVASSKLSDDNGNCNIC